MDPFEPSVDHHEGERDTESFILLDGGVILKISVLVHLVTSVVTMVTASVA